MKTDEYDYRYQELDFPTQAKLADVSQCWAIKKNDI